MRIVWHINILTIDIYYDSIIIDRYPLILYSTKKARENFDGITC